MPVSVPKLKDITEAAKRTAGMIHHTPVLHSRTLNTLFDAALFFKCENFQKAGSFKSRGAVNALFSLDDAILSNGVATHSSGNHAQALARAASVKNIPAYIVMPGNAPSIKVEAVKNYGGLITFCKPDLQERENTLKKVIEKTGAIEIHPYDNFHIVSGQATAAMELINDTPPLDFILAPVGGGGLLGGTALSARFFSNGTKVVGCEPGGADDAFRSFRNGKLIPCTNPRTIADGLLTSLGELPFTIIKKYVHDIVTVSEKAITAAMKLLFERLKIVVEPSAAVPFAAILENKIDVKNKKVGIIISGGNIDSEKLAKIFKQQ